LVLEIKIAKNDNIIEIKALMNLATEVLQKDYLSPEATGGILSVYGFGHKTH